MERGGGFGRGLIHEEETTPQWPRHHDSLLKRAGPGRVKVEAADDIPCAVGHRVGRSVRHDRSLQNEHFSWEESERGYRLRCHSSSRLTLSTSCALISPRSRSLSFKHVMSTNNTTSRQGHGALQTGLTPSGAHGMDDIPDLLWAMPPGHIQQAGAGNGMSWGGTSATPSSAQDPGQAEQSDSLVAGVGAQ